MKIITPVLIIIAFILVSCSQNSTVVSGQDSLKVKHNQITTKHKDVLTKTNNPFDYSQYLSFIPLLPSYTDGQQLTHTEITRYLKIPQGENAISFNASYGDAFILFEGRPNDVHNELTSYPKTKIIIGKNIKATVYKHDEGETIEFIKNNLLFDLTTINKGISLQQLIKISESIRVQATQTPNVIHLSNEGPLSAKELSFIPIMPGKFYVPNGFKLYVQGSSVNINKSSKAETFQITYKKGDSYITVEQSHMKGNEDYSQNSSFRQIKINGVSVFINKRNWGSLPIAQFIKANGEIQTIIYSNISEGEVKKVIESILTSK